MLWGLQICHNLDILKLLWTQGRTSLNASSPLRSRDKSFVFIINLLNNKNTAIRSRSRVCIENIIVVQPFKNYSAHVLQCSQNLAKSFALLHCFFLCIATIQIGPRPSVSRWKTIKHTHTHTVGHLWKRDQPVAVADTCTKRHKHNKHPCSQRDSNARSQQSSGYRPIKFCYILISYTKSCRIRWAGHVAHKGENRNAYRRKSEGRKYLWDFFLYLDGIKPEYVFRKECRRVRTGLICLKIRTNGGPNFGDPENAGDFQTSWGTVSFWRRNLLCGIS